MDQVIFWSGERARVKVNRRLWSMRFDQSFVCVHTRVSVLTGTLPLLLLAMGDRQTHIDPLCHYLSPACRHFLKVMLALAHLFIFAVSLARLSAQ